MLSVAPYAEEESAKAGATDNQFKSGKALVERALVDMTGIDFEEIEQTKDDEFRSWFRLREPKSDCRAIVELFSTHVTLHVVLPRDSHTYYTAEDLWQKHRSKK